jgi:hypothetical protein
MNDIALEASEKECRIMARKKSERPIEENPAAEMGEVDDLKVDLDQVVAGANGDLPAPEIEASLADTEVDLTAPAVEIIAETDEDGTTASSDSTGLAESTELEEMVEIDVEPVDAVLDVEAPADDTTAPSLDALSEEDVIVPEGEPVSEAELPAITLDADVTEPVIEVPSVPPMLEPAAPTRGRPFWWALFGGLLSAAVVLAALYILNGTLSFTRGAQMVDLQTRTSDLQVSARDLGTRVDGLGVRTDAAEAELAALGPLSGQMDVMRAEAAQLQTELLKLRQDRDALTAEIAGLELARSEMAAKVQAVEGNISAVDSVFVGLRDLLLSARPLPADAGAMAPSEAVPPADETETTPAGVATDEPAAAPETTPAP